MLLLYCFEFFLWVEWWDDRRYCAYFFFLCLLSRIMRSTQCIFFLLYVSPIYNIGHFVQSILNNPDSVLLLSRVVLQKQVKMHFRQWYIKDYKFVKTVWASVMLSCIFRTAHIKTCCTVCSSPQRQLSSCTRPIFRLMSFASRTGATLLDLISSLQSMD